MFSMFCAVVLAAAATPAPAPASGLHVLKSLAVPGDGGWDYLTADADARRLYVSHSDHVAVVDLDSEKVVGEVKNTQGVHGIAVAPDLKRGFVSAGRANTVTIFDLGTLATIAEVKTGQNPDAILYEPATHRVFAFNGRSGDATVIEGASGTVAGTVALGGKPEFAVTDGAGRIYVNIEDKSELVALDAKTMAVKSRWPLAPCEEPTGLAFDVAHHRLFSVCGNGLMAVVDAESGRVVTTLPIGQNVDGAAFDAEKGLAFASNGEGTLTVVREESPDRFQVVANVPTQRGARTIALDAKTHRLFLPTAQFGPPPSPSAQTPRPRPPLVPGSFVVLVVGE